MQMIYWAFEVETLRAGGGDCGASHFDQSGADAQGFPASVLACNRATIAMEKLNQRICFPTSLFSLSRRLAIHDQYSCQSQV
jgi:hypothetical protein